MFDINWAESIERLAVAFVPVLLGIVLHEVAHGWVASLRGDLTARMLGRLTLNPVPHIDPTGLMVFGLTALASPVVFGWAKPVPVNARNFHNPRRDMMLVSVAGPLANMLLAFFFALCLKLLFTLVPEQTLATSTVAAFFSLMFYTGVMANLALAWINLLPIPPLDGSHILAGLLPLKWAYWFESMGRYGFMVLILLLFTGVVGAVLMPLVLTSARLIFFLTGLS